MKHPFHCLCCDSTRATPKWLGCRDYYLGTPGVVDYVRCVECGLVQQHPVPTDVSALYDAYPVHDAKSGWMEHIRRLLLSRVYYRPRHATVSSLKLLDFGCGDGAYLVRAKEAGFETVGFEPSAAHAQRVAARTGLPVYSDLAALTESSRSAFDIVTMHFVLEHLTDLHSTFALVRDLLRPDGTFYFVVPQASSLEAALFGRKWHGLDPPRHISFPEPPAVARLAKRHGFGILHHEAAPFPNGFAGSIGPLLLGRFAFPMMVATMPLGVVWSWCWPEGARAFTLIRDP